MKGFWEHQKLYRILEELGFGGLFIVLFLGVSMVLRVLRVLP